jgi:hypothetical protein
MQKLAVLNACLATMGQKPLASIDDRHPLRAAALALLEKHNRTTQASGWWFNREYITLTPDTSGKIIVPGDSLVVRSQDRNLKVATRGPILYNLTDSTDLFTDSLDVELIRLIPFDYLEDVVADYICYCTQKEFQLTYDGDSDKQRRLLEYTENARVMLNAEETRNQPDNWLDRNLGVQRLRNIISYNRRYIR